MSSLPDTLTPAQILGTATIAEQTLPCINAKLTDSALCRAVAVNLPPNTLFRLDDTYLTLDVERKRDNTGTITKALRKRTMTPARLCSWIEQHITFRDGGSTASDKISLNKLQAEKILASDALLAAVPVIREFCDVRLPMWGPDKDGKRTLRLAPVGYDPETQVYTADLVPWDSSKTSTPDYVVKALYHILKEFPWSEEQPFRQTRSVAAFMAYMLGQFCRHLIDRHPIVVINGNQPGSGKSLLAAMGLSAVYGTPDVSPYPQDDDSLSKMLFSQLLARRPYVLIDDLKSLKGDNINRYATSPYITDRALNTNTIIRVENRIQIITTGNNIDTTADVERRSLIVDLFAKDKATDRTISVPLTPYTFAKDTAWRAPLLQLLWSLTNAWAMAGCPLLVDGGKMPSFESFATVSGSIVVHAGFCSPFGPRDVGTDAGDASGRAMEYLLATIAGEIIPAEGDPHAGCTSTYTVEDILDRAEKMDKADIITSAKDKKRSIGQMLRKLKGRAFTDTQGRRFEFGRRKDSAGSKYPFIITSEPPDIQATD